MYGKLKTVIGLSRFFELFASAYDQGVMESYAEGRND